MHRPTECLNFRGGRETEFFTTSEAFVANQRHEEQLYRKHKDFYGYVFYIGKKI